MYYYLKKATPRAVPTTQNFAKVATLKSNNLLSR